MGSYRRHSREPFKAPVKLATPEWTQTPAGLALLEALDAGRGETRVVGGSVRDALLGLAGADADELEQALLASTSPAVRAEVNRQIDHLAVALAGAINILNPQLVVLGGFLAALLAVDADRLRSAVAALSLGASFGTVRLSAAELGSNLLMIGAAELAFEGLLDDPAGLPAVTASPSA